MKQARIKFYLLQFSICIILSIGCSSSDSIKDTKWKVIGIAMDSNNKYSDETQAMLLNFNPVNGFYSHYKDSFLINYLNNSIDTTNYWQEGDNLIFFGKNYENDTTKILRYTKDTLLIRTNNGALIKMAKIDNIPK